MSMFDLNFWAAMLGGGIIGALIGAVATIFFGPRWVEKLRMRRFHAEKIEEVVLKPWLANYDKDYCKVSGEYSVKTMSFVPFMPKDPQDYGNTSIPDPTACSCVAACAVLLPRRTQDRRHGKLPRKTIQSARVFVAISSMLRAP